VWLGALSGVGVSVAFGIVFVIIFYVAKNQLFSGSGRFIFQGLLCYTAACLITVLAFAMLRFMNYEKKWERRLNEAAEKVGRPPRC
jgi:high-affinity Fe2+/Pb2+ permease